MVEVKGPGGGDLPPADNQEGHQAGHQQAIRQATRQAIILTAQRRERPPWLWNLGTN